jgi:hypothetical protein
VGRDRGAGGEKLLDHREPDGRRGFPAAVLARPRHPDPAAPADFPGELRGVTGQPAVGLRDHQPGIGGVPQELADLAPLRGDVG